MWMQKGKERCAAREPVPVSGKTLLILTGALLAACLFIYRQYVFGDQLFVFNDIGSDTLQQYVMHYQSIIGHIRSGNLSFWDFSNGFGTSFFQLNLFDPTLDLLYLFGVLAGPERVLYALVYLQILRILAAGCACCLFLSCFPLGEKSRLIASFSYALCGYLMIWGQHYQFGVAMTYFPLLLFFLERSLKKRFSPGLCVMSFLQIVYSYYLGYMAFATAGIYLILRLFADEETGFSEKFSRFAKTVGQMLLGIGMGCCTLLPGAYTIFGVSSRMKQQTGLLERLADALHPFPYAYYRTLVLKFFSGHLNGRNVEYNGYLNYYEDPNVFFGTLFLILAVQFVCLLCSRKEKRRFRAVGWTALVLQAAVLLLPAGGIAYNGFTTDPTFRFTFALMPFFALMTALTLDRIFREHTVCLPGLVLAVLGIAGGYAWRMTAITDPDYLRNAKILAVTGVGMAVLLFLICKRRGREGERVLIGLFCLLIAGNLVSEGGMSVKNRETVKKGSAYFDELYSEDIRDALAWLSASDSSFYRVEKDFCSATYCMDAMAQNYRGVSTYNSTLNGRLLELITGYFPELLYVNEAHVMFSPCAGRTDLAELFGIRYLLSRAPAPGPAGYQFVKQFGDVSVYRLDTEKGFGAFYSETITPEEFARLAAAQPPAGILNRVLVLENGEKGTSERGTGEVLVNGTDRDCRLNGSVSCTAAGYVMLPIPYEGGWSCEVDGANEELLPADIGFTAFAVPEGAHTFALRYTPPLLREGVWISGVCWLCMALFSALPVLLRKLPVHDGRENQKNARGV